MTVNEFLQYWNGIYCDYDGAYGDQCFDLANGYSRWLGGSRFTGETADLIINQAGTFYTRIDNSPDNSPTKGDIVVWNWPHVGIATGENTDINGFDALEQNDPTGSNCHIKHYTYTGVLGWLRPNKLPEDYEQDFNTCRLDRDENWNIIVAVGTALGIPADSSNKPLTQEKFVSEIKRLQTPPQPPTPPTTQPSEPQPSPDVFDKLAQFLRQLFK